MQAVFDGLQEELNVHDAKKEKIVTSLNSLKTLKRMVLFEVSAIHKAIGDSKAEQAVIDATTTELQKLGEVWTEIEAAVGDNPIEEWTKLWTGHLYDLTMAAAFVFWLKTGQLAKPQDICEMLRFSSAFKLDVEVYLSGLCGLPKELSRLAMNCVRSGSFAKVRAIHAFVNELSSGLRLLNLRNDGLRRKFDGVKYEVNKIDQIMYDIAVRGLDKPSQQ
jgi:predicted translin family RNA/ssDNA-binding protein